MYLNTLRLQNFHAPCTWAVLVQTQVFGQALNSRITWWFVYKCL